jgi:hypothetical protein
MRRMGQVMGIMLPVPTGNTSPAAGPRLPSNLPCLALLAGNSRREVGDMHATQEMEATQNMVLLAAIMIVVFWRTLIKCMIILASIAIIATIGYAAIMIWQSMHHIAG